MFEWNQSVFFGGGGGGGGDESMYTKYAAILSPPINVFLSLPHLPHFLPFRSHPFPYLLLLSYSPSHLVQYSYSGGPRLRPRYPNKSAFTWKPSGHIRYTSCLFLFIISFR